MRVVNVLAALALIVFGSATCGTYVMAQQAAPAGQAASQGTRIAVVDVGMIVKNHPSIKAQQTQIREQVKTAQEDLVKRRQAIVAEAEKLKSFAEGSQEFSQLQEKLANQEAQLKLDTVRREKQLEDSEARMALEFYNQLQTLITQIAEYNQIDLVLRSNTEKPDLKNPATIQMALEKGVVYSRANMDMTKTVLDLLNAQAGAAQPTSGAAAPVSQAAQPGNMRTR